LQEEEHHEHVSRFLLGIVIVGSGRSVCHTDYMAICTESKPAGDLDFVHHYWVENFETDLVAYGNNFNHHSDPAFDRSLPAVGL
jgi:hypothetical protein